MTLFTLSIVQMTVRTIEIFIFILNKTDKHSTEDLYSRYIGGRLIKATNITLTEKPLQKGKDIDYTNGFILLFLFLI